MNDLIPIDLDVLISVIKFSGDVYLKLSDNKFVRIATKGDRFSRAIFEHYMKKRIGLVYIHKSDYPALVKSKNYEIQDLLNNVLADFDLSFNVSASVLGLVRELNPIIGLTKDLQELIAQTISLGMFAIRRSRSIFEIFNELSLASDDYVVSHSILLAYVASGLAMELGLEDVSNTYEICVAGLVHDITVTDSAMARIQQLTAIGYYNGLDDLSPENRKKYRDHPKEAAELVDKLVLDENPKKNQKLIKSVKKLVLEHHERPDGSGFPKGLTHKEIDLNSAIFITAHELVSFVYRSDGNYNMINFLDELPLSMGVGEFSRVFDLLTKTI